MPAGRFTRPGCRSVRTRAPIGRGQDLDRLTTRRGCRRASWSRPSTRSPGRSTRGGCRSVRTRATAAGKTSTRSPRGRLPTCILVEALDTLPWSIDTRRLPIGADPGDGRGQDLDTLTAGRLPNVHPGRGPRHAPPVDAGGKLHAAGLPNSVDPGDGRGQDLDRLTTRPVADVHPGRGPRHAPLVDRHAAVADRCGPGRRPRARPRQAHHAAGLLTCILVEALDTFPQSMPAGSFTRPGCRSVRTRATIGRGQDLDRLTAGRLPTSILVEALDTLPRSMLAGSFTRLGCRSVWTRATAAGQDLDRLTTRRGCQRASWSRPSTRSPGRSTRGGCRSVWTRATAAGRPSTGSPRGGVADVHLGRGPRHAPLVDAGGKLHAAGLPNSADPSDGRGQDLDRLTTRRGCRRASWSRPSTRSPGRSTRDGCRSVWTRATAAGKTSTGSPRGGAADVHPGRGPRHAPLIDRHAAVADRCGPGRRPRARPRQAHHAAGCRRASWSRPSTRSPGRSTRGGCRSVRTRATAAGKTSTGSPRGRLPTCILVEALDTLPWSIDTRRLPIGVDPGDGRGQDLDRLTTRRGCRRASWSRPSTRSPGGCRREASRGRVADRCGPGRRPRARPRQAHHAAGCRRASWSRPSTRSPGRCWREASRGRLPTCILVEALDTPLVDAGGKLHAAGLPIGADPGADRPRARPRQAHHAAGCQRASWSRPSTRSPGRCRREASRGRAADQCGAGPGRRPRARPRQAHHAAGLPTCILVEALDTLPRSMPAGSFTRPGCRSVWTRATAAGQDLDRLTTRPVADVHLGRGPRHAPGRCWREASRGRVAEQCGPGRQSAAGKTSTGSPRGRLPTCILVEALDTLPRSIDTRRLPIGADPGDGRGQDLDTLTARPAADTLPRSMPAGSFTRPGCRTVRTRATAAGKTSTGSPRGRLPTRSPGRCRRGASRGGGADVHPGRSTRGRRRSAAGRTSTGSPRGGAADVHLGRGPRHAPLVDRHAAVADRCGPGRRPRGRTSTGAPRGGAADVHPGRGPRHAPPVDAGGKLHAAGLPNSVDPGDGRGQDLDRRTTRPVADVHPGRGPRHAPLVDAGGKLHAAVADRCGPGRRPRGRTSTGSPRGGVADVHPGRCPPPPRNP